MITCMYICIYFHNKRNRIMLMYTGMFIFNIQIFSELKVEVPLQTAAREGSELTSRFACQALRTMGSQLPPYHYWDVLNWTPDQVRDRLTKL